MAQKVQTLFIDDLDGGEADGTVTAAVDRDLGFIAAGHSVVTQAARGVGLTCR
jgi:hypothetical protein